MNSAFWHISRSTFKSNVSIETSRSSSENSRKPKGKKTPGVWVAPIVTLSKAKSNTDDEQDDQQIDQRENTESKIQYQRGIRANFIFIL